ncbi:MAG: hypothetical protein ABSC60_02865 [Acidobacteriota bacterium]|jgi:hypothetical protein
MIEKGDNTPKWIQKQKREKAEEKRQADEITQRQLDAAMLIQQKGPDFWQQLVNRLEANVTALPELEDEELAGSVSPSAPSGGELSCFIEVDRRSVEFGPELSHMSLLYKSGGSRIRRWYQDREMNDIELVTYHNEVRAVIDGSAPMTAEDLGDQIVEWMAERVKAKRSL